MKILCQSVAILIFFFVFSCNKPDEPGLTTQDVTEINYRTAACGGKVTDDGGDPITSRGLCWNTTGNPTVEDNIVNCGGGTGPFHKSLSNLTPGTTYYIRAYATNSEKTGYGNEVTFQTLQVLIPVLKTYCITFDDQTTIKTGGVITELNGGTVSERGVCWSTTNVPDLNSEKNSATNTDIYSYFYSSVSGLTPGTKYYLRAFATNEAGTGYGNELEFTVHIDGAAISDVDGNVYNTVKIGTQTWIAENLRTTSFNDRTPLINIINGYNDNELYVYAWYENNQDKYKAQYGALYNYYTVNPMWELVVKNVCPAGWHVPRNKEWATLVSFLGGEQFAGGKLKEKGTAHWAAPNSEATDEYGFGALPGGSTDFHYGSNSLGTFGSWWASDLGYNNNVAYNMVYSLDAYSGSIVKLPVSGHNGYSVRCIRDY
jgi:uncharacterized protein (TIGR02145 family)